MDFWTALLVIGFVAISSASVLNNSTADAAINVDVFSEPSIPTVPKPLTSHSDGDATYFQVRIPTGAEQHLLKHPVILPYEYHSSGSEGIVDFARVFYNPNDELSDSSTHNLLPLPTFVDTCEFDNNCKAFFVIGTVANAMAQLLQVLIECDLWLGRNFTLVDYAFVDPRSRKTHFVIPQSLIGIRTVDDECHNLLHVLDQYIVSVLDRPKWSVEATDWILLQKALREEPFSDHETHLASIANYMSFAASIPNYDKMFGSFVLDAPLVINQRDIFFDVQHRMPSIDRTSNIVMAQLTRTPMNLDGTPVSATLKKDDMCLVAYSTEFIHGSIHLEDNLKRLFFSVISEVEYAPFLQSAYYIVCAQPSMLGTISYAVVFEFNQSSLPTLLSECRAGSPHPKWREIIMAIGMDCMETNNRFGFLHGRINADMIISTRFDDKGVEADDDESPIYQWRPFAFGMAPHVQERPFSSHKKSCAWIAPERLGTIAEMTTPHTEAMDVWAFGILILQLTGAKYEIVDLDPTGRSAPLSAGLSSSSAAEEIVGIPWLGQDKYLRYSLTVNEDDATYLDELLSSILIANPTSRWKWVDVICSQLFQAWSCFITPESCSRVMAPMIEHRHGRVVGWNPRCFLSFNRQIGMGGQGSVVKAINRLGQGAVALKFMYSQYSSHDSMTLDGLAQPDVEFWLTQPRHPNVASLIASFSYVQRQDSGNPQLCTCSMMELATCDVSRLLVSSNQMLKRAITDRECAFIIRSVCLALEHLHSLGVIHCDVKSANVLFYANPADPNLENLMLHRFALADLNSTFIVNRSLRHSKLQRYSVPKCTTKYVRAPEQFRNEIHGDGVDIWATGVMLGELLNRCVYHSFDYDYILGLCSGLACHSNAISSVSLSRHYANRHRPAGTEPSQSQSDMINTFLHMTMKMDPNSRCSAAELLKFPLMKLLDEPLMSNKVENFMYDTQIQHWLYTDVPHRPYHIDTVTGLPVQLDHVHINCLLDAQLFKERLMAVMFKIKSKHFVKFLRAHLLSIGLSEKAPVMMVMQYHKPSLFELTKTPALVSFDLLVRTGVALLDLLINLSECHIVHGRIALSNMFVQKTINGIVVIIGMLDMLPRSIDDGQSVKRDLFDAAAAMRELTSIFAQSNPITEHQDMLNQFIAKLTDDNVSLNELKHYLLVI